MDNNLNKISKDKFEFVQMSERIFDKPPETKPVGYYRDAWRRFKKNKASVVAACVILFLILFSFIAPIFAPFSMAFKETAYTNMVPKSFLSNGVVTKTFGADNYEKELSKGVGAEHFNLVGLTKAQAAAVIATIDDGLASKYSAVKKVAIESEVELADGSTVINYTFQMDSYNAVGFLWKRVTPTDYQAMKEWQEETGYPLLYPVPDLTNDPNGKSAENANFWYKHDSVGNAIRNGQRKAIYEEFEENYWTMNGVISDYIPRSGGSVYEIRVLADSWFRYTYGTAPAFFLGTNSLGQDILIRLANGIQTSLVLGISIVLTCFIIGSIIGAIQGYYGGWFDLISERVIEVLYYIPFTAVLVLVQLYWIDTQKLSTIAAVFIAFIMTGWIGDAGAMRSQFYRFKHQEYVLVARTLGAHDTRIMFKHILPNSLGTIITGVVLSIPQFIFTETSLSYLGIIRLDGPTTSSVGALLSDGQQNMMTSPHIIFWPALVISLLMISFNLFGNGLRDAFNPQLRGSED